MIALVTGSKLTGKEPSGETFSVQSGVMIVRICRISGNDFIWSRPS